MDAFNADDLVGNSYIHADKTDYQYENDSGLHALQGIAHGFDIAISLEHLQLARAKSDAPLSIQSFMLLAQSLSLEVAVFSLSELNVAQQLPSVLYFNGHFFLIERMDDAQIHLLNPVNQSPLSLAIENVDGESQVLLFKSVAAHQPSQKSLSFSRFFPLIARHKSSLAWILMASALIQAVALVTPKVFQVVIDDVLSHRTLETLTVLAIVLIIMALYDPLMHFIRSVLFAHLSSSLSTKMLAEVYAHLLKLPMAFFGRHQNGQLIARLREMDHVRNFLASSALMSLIDLLFVGIFLLVMFYYAAQLAWIVIATLLVLFAVWLALAPFFQRRVEINYQHNANNHGFLTESVTGIELIKSSDIDQQLDKDWKDRLALAVNSQKRVTLFGQNASYVIVLISKLSTVCILYFGTQMVMDGKLTVGELVAFNILSSHVTLPILRLAQFWQDLQQSKTAIQRLGLIVNEQPERSLDLGQSALPEIQGEIAFQQVCFRYQASSPEVFTQLSFHIPAKSCIGIVGESGSGKSSIAKLLQKMVTPQHGQIRIDQLDIQLADSQALRQKVGVVLQESLLFNGTIRDNIVLAKPSISEQALASILVLTGIDQMLKHLPEGLDTQVGEFGGQLSGGQKQRIAIARSLVLDPPILIFDEATAALDVESEQIIMRCINSLKGKKTLVIIAHRLNTTTLCDDILVIDQGQVRERGSPEALLQQNSYYRKIFESQSY
ncbi:MAG: ABC transporter transmembrane domain-containing protein [Cellvibrionales bacterium]|nr:ABC transporter transmembrane domain-containing protein [Cellvibrionales bacterium]